MSQDELTWNLLTTSIPVTFMHYNFCRIHQSLRIMPVMAAGLADHVWEIEELVGMLG